jgi:hypothetical protein
LLQAYSSLSGALKFTFLNLERQNECVMFSKPWSICNHHDTLVTDKQSSLGLNFISGET